MSFYLLLLEELRPYVSFFPPGKPFSAIPMLTSTTGFLTNSQTPYTRLPQPDRPDLQPGPTSQSGSAAATAAAAVSDPSHHQNEAAIHKLSESQHEHETDFDGDVMGKPLTACYPSDAKFPGKHGAATLFFADCLSSKHKEQHKNQ